MDDELKESVGFLDRDFGKSQREVMQAEIDHLRAEIKNYKALIATLNDHISRYIYARQNRRDYLKEVNAQPPVSYL